jgi:hypothetical protein
MISLDVGASTEQPPLGVVKLCGEDGVAVEQGTLARGLGVSQRLLRSPDVGLQDDRGLVDVADPLAPLGDRLRLPAFAAGVVLLDLNLLHQAGARDGGVTRGLAQLGEPSARILDLVRRRFLLRPAGLSFKHGSLLLRL